MPEDHSESRSVPSPVLRTTMAIVARLRAGDSISYEERDACVHVVRRRGSAADADALLDVFLEAPGSRDWVLPLVAAHGTSAHATRLHERCIIDGESRLVDGFPSAVLRVLGHLGDASATPTLWAVASADTSDHASVTDACVGLLDLPCDGLGPAIGAALSKIEGENVFPELLPSLAVKTGNPLWIPRLVRWGASAASTDCNGGLILGVAAFGAPARHALDTILWDPWWEAHSSATGSRYWSWLATRLHAITMRGLYTHALAVPAGDARRHALQMVASLAELWFSPCELRAATPPPESALDLLALLFRWSTPDRDDSLIQRARDAFETANVPDTPIFARLYELERMLRIRAAYELETQELVDR